MPSKLDPYKEIINEKLKLCCSYNSIYKFICKKEYQGKYTIIRDYFSLYKLDEIKKDTIRFETNHGLQAQVDWKETMSKKRVMAILFSSLLMGITITARTYISNNNIGVESEIKCEEKYLQDEKGQSFKEFDNKDLKHSIQKRKIIKDTNPDVDVCEPRSTNQNFKKK